MGLISGRPMTRDEALLILCMEEDPAKATEPLDEDSFQETLEP